VRVALVHNLPPGGALRYVEEFVARTKPPHEVEVFAYGEASAPHGAATNRLGAAYRTVRAIRESLRIAEVIDRAGFDVAFVHHDRSTTAPAALAKLRTPTVYYCQEPRRRSFEFDRRMEGRPRGVALGVFIALDLAIRGADIRWARRATDLLCNSHFSRESILRAYGRTASVCALGVDDDIFRPGEPSAKERFILSVGALDAVKGHHEVVAAAAHIPSGERPRVVVVANRGHDAYEASLRQLAKAADVDLEVWRDQPDMKLADLYRRAMVTVCAGRLEPFGLTALESWASGTPVVAIREGGYRETVIEGCNGVLADPQEGAIAAAIREVLDGPLAQVAAEDIRRSVLPFWTWEAAVGRTWRHLEAFVAGSRRGSAASTRIDPPCAS
jgi:glycosyltransferase involved in cell wall biosynthesis